MPDIIANANDGVVTISSQTSHANARDADSATVSQTTSDSSTTGVRYIKSSGRGGGSSYFISRTFFYFDTSTISSTVVSATLRIFGKNNGLADLIVMKSDAFGGDGGTALATTDFNNIVGQTDGESMSVSSGCVEYSSEVASWNTSTVNVITLNAAALSDMVSDDFFIIALVQFDNDYLNVDPPIPVSLTTGVFLSEVSNTAQKPTLRYNLGYGNDVIGLAAANIGKINTVATANIGKVNSLD